MPRNSSSPSPELSATPIPDLSAATGSSSILQQTVDHAVKDYLAMMDDQPVSDLHDLVIGEVEAAMMRCILEHTKSNQSRAAEILGVSRGTLRTKLRKYRLL